jgi:hypothetical protein
LGSTMRCRPLVPYVRICGPGIYGAFAESALTGPGIRALTSAATGWADACSRLREKTDGTANPPFHP